MTDTPVVHVAAAVVFDPQGRVMITRRPAHAHQGGLWEFPGGKLEAGESAQDALQREIFEEVGIELVSFHPLIRVHHAYPDKSVLLDVWRVDEFTGEAHGREGQALQWVLPGQLVDYEFPAANQPIINAACLPERYLISPEPDMSEQKFLSSVSQALESGIRLLQLRAKNMPAESYLRLAHKVQQLCRAANCHLMLNAQPEVVMQIGADGVHLSSGRLMALSVRPLSREYRVAASCHSRAELQHAAAIGVDFAVLGPVAATLSHAGTQAMGWDGFYELADQAALPVYALGGMKQQDLEQALANGAQGIAAIRGLWPLTSD